MPDHPHLVPRLRLKLGQDIALGPGKAQLLDAIAQGHSISAAAKSLGMSYRRAWLLVDTMNRCFKAPLVTTATGGRHGGGAQLSELGRQVLDLYQQYQQTVQACAELRALEQLLAPPTETNEQP
ncbi:winged helix-turn-helix domain-containing protein [Marinobacter zhejiangensis]|uniref:Molybdate transport system regulatory protein n=1 Tax=Marinobacter zhejiangensis TaxID=488535 RepID=A0A1I4L3V3_9GAMM|nr:winged helix-turn-helix domain-containing protein [Marinobacter zhejiangensis]SFL85327.1 molybdate transport system regulatory protein [Marinobacter zhejiangensis]